ncbi:MAG: nucleotidyltransferase domain-containing protein [Thermoflexales bacterium]|nr:nucleotidyltransferase domain-containing protein [Thermoflexales bacterium]MDW8352433.1 nucleotidyltransferase domain-containing protein [Anaerolineae bacterium]
MTPIHLDPAHLRIVLRILRRHAPDAQAYVFGSRAGKQAKPHSDLDLLLREGGPIAPLRFAALCADFEDSDLPFRVDVLDYHLTDPDFLQRIAPECVPLPAHVTQSETE